MTSEKQQREQQSQSLRERRCSRCLGRRSWSPQRACGRAEGEWGEWSSRKKPLCTDPNLICPTLLSHSVGCREARGVRREVQHVKGERKGFVLMFVFLFPTTQIF